MAQEPALAPEEPPYFELSCNFSGPFPYTASLRDENGTYRCGAVLIEKNAVLTAASCVDSARHGARDVSEVFLGGFDREVPIERINMKAVFIHPDYTGNPMDGADLAVVKLAEETCLSPIPFIGRQTDRDENYLILGFGRTGPLDPLSGALQGANATNLELVTCNDALDSDQLLGEEKICTQTPQCSCASICEGDEGGPLVYRETLFEFKDTLMGIMSYSTRSCEEKGGFGVHTDAQLFKNWIERTVQSQAFEDC